MQNQNSKLITFKALTPLSEPIIIECDSVHLPAAGDKNGKGGGSYGIRYGHANAVIALDKGKILLFKNGEKIGSFLCSQGFARVEKDSVTVVTEEIESIM